VKTSVYYITELVNSYFHLCEHGYHRDHVNVDALTTGVTTQGKALATSMLSLQND